MSGGHFDYDQYRIGQIADEIEKLILDNNSTEKDSFGDEKGNNYKPKTIIKFKKAIVLLRKTEIMVQRIDWLVSGNDGEASFHQRWKEEIDKLNV